MSIHNVILFDLKHLLEQLTIKFLILIIELNGSHLIIMYINFCIKALYFPICFTINKSILLKFIYLS